MARQRNNAARRAHNARMRNGARARRQHRWRAWRVGARRARAALALKSIICRIFAKSCNARRAARGVARNGALSAMLRAQRAAARARGAARRAARGTSTRAGYRGENDAIKSRKRKEGHQTSIREQNDNGENNISSRDDDIGILAIGLSDMKNIRRKGDYPLVSDRISAYIHVVHGWLAGWLLARHCLAR